MRLYSFHNFLATKLALVIYLSIYSISGNTQDISINAKQVSELDTDRYFVISIGVNNYRDSYWPKLKWSAKDAELVSDTLGVGTNKKIVKKLLINETATLNKVHTTLKEVTEQSTANDTVVLYISAHGTLSQSVTGELEQLVVLHDTINSQLSTTGLSHTTVNNWLNSIKARKKMIIFATCHSGEGKSRLPPDIHKLLQSRKGYLIPLSEVSRGYMVFAAAAQGEAAYENDDLRGDIYTHYFLEAIKVNDRNKDGVVSALEAHDYARDRTWDFTNGRQRPTVRAKLIGDADIALNGSRKHDGLPVLQAYDKQLSGLLLQVDQSRKGKLPTAFPLNPQGSKIALFAAGDELPIARYSVTIPKGQTITLEKVMKHRLFNLGFTSRRNAWSDSDRKKISGGTTDTSHALYTSLNFKQFSLGLTANLPKQYSGTTRNSISSNVTLNSILFFTALHKRHHLFNFSTRIEYGLESMEITLTDNFNGNELQFEDTSNVYGLAFTLMYNFILDFVATLEMGYRNTAWEFDTIGELSGERKWIGIGIGYNFDWRARTIW